MRNRNSNGQNRNQNGNQNSDRNHGGQQGRQGGRGYDPRLDQVDPRMQYGQNLFGGIHPSMLGYGFQGQVPGQFGGQWGGQPQGQQFGGQEQGRGRRSRGGRGRQQGLDVQGVDRTADGIDRGHGEFRGVGPRGFTRSDDRLREDVSLILADHPRIDASNIEVNVKSGEVTLTGDVSDLRTKQLITQVLSQVPGIQQIFDTVRVTRRDQDQTQSLQGGPAVARTGKDQRPHAS